MKVIVFCNLGDPDRFEMGNNKFQVLARVPRDLIPSTISSDLEYAVRSTYIHGGTTPMRKKTP
jgi:hypothetical protein